MYLGLVQPGTWVLSVLLPVVILVLAGTKMGNVPSAFLSLVQGV